MRIRHPSAPAMPPLQEARTNAPGMAESHCPKCGQLLTHLLTDLAAQRVIPHPGIPNFGIACPECLTQLITTGLPFAEVLNVIAVSSQTLAQSNMVLDAVHRAKIARDQHKRKVH